MSHTKGPWRVSESRTSGFCIVREGASDGAVVGCQDEYDHYGAVFKAEDAQLIAAAPELLEALELLLYTRTQERHLQGLKPGESPLHDRCNAAIAKAKGLNP